MEHQSQSKSEFSFGFSIEAYNIYNDREPIYYSWKLYFPDEEYDETSETNRKVQAFQDFLVRNQSLVSSITLEIGLILDLNLLYNDNDFLDNWPNFMNDIQCKPEHTLKCLKFGAHMIVLKAETLNNLEYVLQNRYRVQVKIQNYAPIIPIKLIKENLHEMLVSVRGYIVKLCNSELVSQWLVFCCTTCDLQVIVKQRDGLRVQPTVCNICGIKQWNQVLDSPYSTNIRTQTVKIWERIDCEEACPVTVAPMIYVQLLDDMVNHCLPGDIVTITGIVKVTRSKASVHKGLRKNDLYIEAVSVVNHTKASTDLYELTLNPNQDLIREIRNQQNIFKILVRSLCPTLHGQDIFKATLLLSLFGGTDSHIHVLIITNPGFAKTPLLQSCADAASKGIYVRGSKCTNSGIAVTVSQGKGIESFTMEARALVLANNGHCCIDELEVLTNQHRILTNAMAQGSVRITQPNLVCCLATRTTILASIMPIGGRYNRSKTLLQNLNVRQALLSQFDLVCILSDQQDRANDKLLCDRIMSLHARTPVTVKSENSFMHSLGQDSFASRLSLKQKLASSVEELVDTIPCQLLKMYIGYAKEYVKPKLSAGAVTVLSNFLEDYTQNNQVGSYESQTLVKLAQARAKVELRNEVTEADALEVVELYEFVRSSVLDATQITSIISPREVGKVTKNKVQMFLNLLKTEANLLQKSIFSFAELNDIARNGNINVTDFKDLISNLNEQGYLLILRAGTYKVVI